MLTPAPHLQLTQSQGAGIAATVVFALHSIVNVEIPLKTTSFQAKMYELLVQEVEVENPFSGDCDFALSLVPFEHAEPEKKEDHKAKKDHRASTGAAKRASQANAEAEDKQEQRRKATAGVRSQTLCLANWPQSDVAGGPTLRVQRLDFSPRLSCRLPFRGLRAHCVLNVLRAHCVLLQMFPPPFGCDRSRLRLRRGEKALVKVSYLPFCVGHHHARLRLEDSAFGPFLYELHGESSQPAHTGPVKAPVDARGPGLKEISLPFLNPLLEAAKKAYAERHPGSKDKANLELVRALGMKLEEAVFSVEVQQSPFVSAPPVVTLQSAADTKTRARFSTTGPRQSTAQQAKRASMGGEAGEGGGGASPGPAPGSGGKATASPNVLVLTLNPQLGVGVYNARVVLTSDFDIRCAARGNAQGFLTLTFSVLRDLLRGCLSVLSRSC